MLEGKQLLDLWESEKADGVTMAELAERLGYSSRKALDSKLARHPAQTEKREKREARGTNRHRRPVSPSLKTRRQYSQATKT